MEEQEELKLISPPRTRVSRGETYPVENGRPAFHRDALEHSQHGEPDVVEAGDPEVGTLPLFDAHAVAAVAHVSTGRCYRVVVRVARRWKLTLLDYLSCKNTPHPPQ